MDHGDRIYESESMEFIKFNLGCSTVFLRTPKMRMYDGFRIPFKAVGFLFAPGRVAYICDGL